MRCALTPPSIDQKDRHLEVNQADRINNTFYLTTCGLYLIASSSRLNIDLSKVRHHAYSTRQSTQLKGLHYSCCYKAIILLTYPIQNLFFAFTGLVAASAAWSIFGGDIFPQQPDPTGGKFPSPIMILKTGRLNRTNNRT